MSNTRHYLMTIPMPMAMAGDAVVWAAEHFDSNTAYEVCLGNQPHCH